MGPLQGVKIVEMAGLGPAPFCGMLLADMGADVIVVDRLVAGGGDMYQVDPRFNFLNRSKRAVAIDLKSPDGVQTIKDLISKADLLIEGFRPGVMERLGLGPDVAQAVNPKLVYGRMTGWGQEGPLKDIAGHDINYIALTGALAAIGPADGNPVVPLNLVGDFGGGALYLAMGLLAALVEARTSGRGQVVDAAMVDGAASLMTMMHGFLHAGQWENRRGGNAIDGSAPFYTTYATSDGKFMAVGAIESRFYKELVEKLGFDFTSLPNRNDQANWPTIREGFAAVFASRTRAEWSEIFAASDACVSPVLDMSEAAGHPHMAARGTFITADGITEPAPAPRFSRTPSAIRNVPLDAKSDTKAALLGWGIAADTVAALATAGVIARADQPMMAMP